MSKNRKKIQKPDKATNLKPIGKASPSYFKHTIYGLRFFFRLYDMEDRALQLPSISHGRKLPTVFSRQELKRLFKAPQRLKQRVLFSQ